MTEKQDAINHAHMIFLEQCSKLPYNTERAYIKVQLSDCELFIPCKHQDENIMQKTKIAFTNIATIARY
jgi:hypothetical protein